MAAADHIKIGMKRSEVEREFVTEGGPDFRTETIYTFRLCPLIKVRVRFSLDPGEARNASPNAPVTAPDSPNDVVESVGQLYLQYPVRD